MAVKAVIPLYSRLLDLLSSSFAVAHKQFKVINQI